MALVYFFINLLQKKVSCDIKKLTIIVVKIHETEGDDFGNVKND